MPLIFKIMITSFITLLIFARLHDANNQGVAEDNEKLRILGLVGTTVSITMFVFSVLWVVWMMV